MAHTEFADRIKETTTTTGTGTINLGGAVSGYQTFVQGLGNGHYTYYSIFHQAANEWEVGLGLVTDAATDTLSRDTVLSSSNGGLLVNFSAGTKDVICTMPASKSVIIDGDSNISVTANMTATSFAGSGAALTSLNATNVASGTLDDARLTGNVALITGASFTGNLNLANNVTLNIGSTLDIFSTGTSSYIAEAGSGDLYIKGSNIYFTDTENNQYAVMSDQGTGGAVTLKHLGSTKLVTSSTGVNVTGTVNATTFAGSGSELTALNASNVSSGTLDSARLSGDVVLTSGATFTGNVAFGDLDYVLMGPTGEYQIYHDHANGVSTIKDADVGGKINIEADTIQLTGPVTATANVSLGDNNRLLVGTGNDLQLWHDGTSSYIIDTGTGDLNIRGASNVNIQSFPTENMITCQYNGAVELYYDNSKKLETTSTGIAVTGEATFTANVDLGDDDYLRLGNTQDLLIYHKANGESVIEEVAGGSLTIRGTNLNLQNQGGTYAYFVGTGATGAAQLRYGNSAKLDTTATGISVTGTVVESSSIDYKENVKPLQFNDAIYSVNAVKYDRKDGSAKDEVGVIAEELYEVLPDLVSLKDGKPDAVAYTKLTMYLLEALKKQNQEIQELKQRLN